jgi:hypothetical protein
MEEQQHGINEWAAGRTGQPGGGLAAAVRPRPMLRAQLALGANELPTYG